jgi:hypothetical protein
MMLVARIKRLTQPLDRYKAVDNFSHYATCWDSY